MSRQLQDTAPSRDQQGPRTSPRLLLLTTVPITVLSFLKPYGTYFRSLGWEVDAGARGLTQNAAELTSVFNQVHDLPWSRSALSPENLTRASSALRSLVRSGGYDLVHVHTPIASFLTRFALRNFRPGTKVIYTAHGFHFGHSSRSPWFNPFFYCEKLAGPWTDALIVINQDDHRLALAQRIVPERNLHYMPGIGVDLSLYSRQGFGRSELHALRSELRIPPGAFLFLMIAEFNPGKRHADLLRAFQLIQDSNVHLAFAGTGLLLEETKSLAERLGVADRVHFLGFRKDIPALIAASNACILPSEREGLPRSILEAMAIGTPVLGSRIRGIRDLLADDSGLLFEVGNLQAIKDCMVTAVRDPEGLRRLAENAQEKVKKYSLPVLLQRHHQLYGSLLSQSG